MGRKNRQILHQTYNNHESYRFCLRGYKKIFRLCITKLWAKTHQYLQVMSSHGQSYTFHNSQ